MPNIKFITSIFTVFIFNAFAISNDYPKYHLAPLKGWINDPNGFCFFNGTYHLFYQHNPYSSYEPGIAHWGHAISKDLFHWIHRPIAMYPDQWYDVGGVFSGSCLVEDGKMYLFYTGNVNHEAETPDHNQYQALATSEDGENITKYEMNPIINGTTFQPDLRDPKIWKHGHKYYMVLGNSFKGKSNETLGRVLLWISTDKVKWEVASVLLESKGELGYMFECPDFFELNGFWVLLFSPQGIKPQGDNFVNLYQTGYVLGIFSYKTNVFIVTYKFKELDHGHDFYATQTVIDQNGNRIVIAWMDMWERNYTEMREGFRGRMTIPRRLNVSKKGEIIQTPVKEIDVAKGRVIYSGKPTDDFALKLEDNTAEILIQASSLHDLELLIESEKVTVKMIFNPKQGFVTLDRGGKDGVRRTKWKPKTKLTWLLYIDASSIELFCGKGEVTMTSKFYPDGPVTIKYRKETEVEHMTVTSMKQTVDIHP